MVEWKDGIVNISEDLCIEPGFTFDAFKQTKEYNGQDGIRVINLTKEYCIDGHKYYVSLFFRQGKIYMVSLLCNDINYSENTEMERKLMHDKILKEYGLTEENYSWGKLKSNYDKRGNISSIGFCYIENEK